LFTSTGVHPGGGRMTHVASLKFQGGGGDRFKFCIM